MNAPQKKRKRVLIVEDDDAFAGLACEYLEKENVDAGSAANTAAALASMKMNPADLVLLDIHLGGEDGLAFLLVLKKLYPKIPVVVLTGIGYDNAMMKVAMRNGAATYFSKENNFQDLIGLLERLLK